MKKLRNPPDVHPPLAAYSHQIEISGGERLLAMAGQVGMSADGTIPDDAVDQLDLALENVRRNLDAAGMEMRDLVKVTLYLVGELDAEERRRVLAAKLGDHRPCMTLLFVSALASPALKVEVDVWAAA